MATNQPRFLQPFFSHFQQWVVRPWFPFLNRIYHRSSTGPVLDVSFYALGGLVFNVRSQPPCWRSHMERPQWEEEALRLTQREAQLVSASAELKLPTVLPKYQTFEWPYRIFQHISPVMTAASANITLKNCSPVPSQPISSGEKNRLLLFEAKFKVTCEAAITKTEATG